MAKLDANDRKLLRPTQGPWNRPWITLLSACSLVVVACAFSSTNSEAQQLTERTRSSINPVQITTLNSYSMRARLLYGQTELGSFDFTHRTRNGDNPDPWFAMDKLQHVAFSFFITTGSQYGLVNKLEFRERNALPVSVGISLLAGVSKEFYDSRSRPNGYFSKRDLVADGLGIVLATGLILL